MSSDEGASAYHAWERATTTVTSDHELFNLVIKRSISDLRLLINEGPGPDQRYIAAGVPWFSTLFGRDALITAIQSLAVRPSLAVETLTTLAAYQATEDDPSRDAEPGKILHELRTGEMARNGELPHTPYYGSVDSTPLWLILLGATFDWTGDRDLVDRLWPNAMAALDWIDRYGDRDGDGFVEYERRSDRGLVNQGWKDSSDAIRDRHGREAVTPIALAEVQGYVYDAKRRMAALARMRGEEELATRLEADAETLRDRFEAAFWVEDLRYYAMALDGDEAAGRCHRLERRAVPVDRHRQPGTRARRRRPPAASLDVQRLGHPDLRDRAARLQPDGLPHGIGLAARHVAHRGGLSSATASTMPRTGWPARCSRRPSASPTTACPSCSAASTGATRRRRSRTRSPARRRPGPPVRRSCSSRRCSGCERTPTATSSSSPTRTCPSGSSKVTLTDLQVGDATVDLLFHRWRGTTSAEVLRKVGDLAVTVRL